MIYLRKLKEEDLEYLISIENNVSFWKYSFNNQKYSKDDLEGLIKDSKLPIELTNQVRYVICRSIDNEKVGFVDLFNVDFDNFKAGVGILIPNKQYRSKGYGKSALRKIIKLSTEKLKINNLYCNIVNNNMPSINCFKSVGFKEIDSKSDLHIASTEKFDLKSVIQFQCT